MRLTLRYFASIRERLGSPSEELEVPEGTTVSEVWDRLVGREPALAIQRYRPAVNQEYTSTGHVLRDGDELVFIPPVSGGSNQ